MQGASTRSTDRAAFGVGAAVGVLGGLIGLGGAEFRLPALLVWFRYPLLLAIVLNLLVSLVTVLGSLGFRLQVHGVEPLLPYWPIALNILVGSITGAYIAVHFATNIAQDVLIRVVAAILAILGVLLMSHEWLVSQDISITDPALRMVLAIGAGLIIGAVSSLLGVAGGELIIPTLVLLFGLDIKIAGSVSLLISIPTIIVGILRYRTRAVFRDVLPQGRFLLFMSCGSLLGAGIGSLLLPYAPAALLHLLLGTILLISALKILRSRTRSVPVQ